MKIRTLNQTLKILTDNVEKEIEYATEEKDEEYIKEIKDCFKRILTALLKAKQNWFVGKRFGKLVVLRPSLYSSKSYWCKCDCGTEVHKTEGQLKSGRVISCECGCMRSKGEYYVEKILKDNQIKIEPQWERWYRCEYPMKFDFYLPEKNTCIEYNGKQHYEPIKHFGGEYAYADQFFRDERKRKFCKENGIKLVEIPYTENNEEKIKNFLIDQNVIQPIVVG